jgi:hypothetical protein
LLVKVAPVTGEVMIAGLLGRGGGTAACTVYEPEHAGFVGTPQSVPPHAIADFVAPAKYTPAANNTKTSNA